MKPTNHDEFTRYLYERMGYYADLLKLNLKTDEKTDYEKRLDELQKITRVFTAIPDDTFMFKVSKAELLTYLYDELYYHESLLKEQHKKLDNYRYLEERYKVDMLKDLIKDVDKRFIGIFSSIKERGTKND